MFFVLDKWRIQYIPKQGRSVIPGKITLEILINFSGTISSFLSISTSSPINSWSAYL